MGRNYKQYHDKIDAILRRLDGGQPSDAELERIASDLDGLAGSYQTDEALGTNRYKLYAAQASIERYRGNDQRAREFMEEAVRVKGTSFAFAKEFLGQLPPPKNQWQTALDKLSTWQAALIIAIIGCAVFCTGLFNGFIGDDVSQIVKNVPVHSIGNFFSFFAGSTFYNGHSSLAGIYYRPLMTTTFSLVYSVFGARPLYYHALQLLLHILAAFVLYLIFRRFFRPALALVLAIIFLVHPINSQAVFLIAAIQEPLFVLFGTIAIWLLLRFTSVKSLVVVAVCLLLSMFAKETGMLFVVISLIYELLFDRRRLFWLIGLLVPAVLVYLTLKTHAVGLAQATKNLAPIDNLGIGGRLLAAPSIILFYLLMFIFPLNLASGRYWIYPNVTFTHTLVPIAIDAAVLALVVHLLLVLRRKSAEVHYLTFMFFSLWAALGVLVHLQIIPLDMTANEAWFYFPIAGVLGTVGVLLEAFPLKLKRQWAIAGLALLIGLLGFRTAIRGLDWKNAVRLAYHDIAVTKEDYVAENNIALDLLHKNKTQEAKAHAEHSIHLYPSRDGYYTFGLSLIILGDYPGGKAALEQAVKLQDLNYLEYDDLGVLTTVYGSPTENRQFLTDAVDKFPEDGKLWYYLAILDQRNGDNTDALNEISKAAQLGTTNQYVYEHIQNNQPLVLNIKLRLALPDEL